MTADSQTKANSVVDSLNRRKVSLERRIDETKAERDEYVEASDASLAKLREELADVTEALSTLVEAGL